jgi:hypothetical protein
MSSDESTLYTCTDCGGIKSRNHFTSANNNRGCCYICNICRGVRRREALLLNNKTIDKLEIIKVALKLTKSIQDVLDLTNLAIKADLFSGHAEMFLTCVSKRFPKSYCTFLKKLLSSNDAESDDENDSDADVTPPTPELTLKHVPQPIKVIDLPKSEQQTKVITFN